MPQDIYLADTTIAENIAIGIPRELHDIEKIDLAAKKQKFMNL